MDELTLPVMTADEAKNLITIRANGLQVKADLTVTGWNLPATITEADWKKAGEILVKFDQAKQWWLGDWWNACKWGDGRQACEEIGVDYQTAQDCGMVARAFQFSRRREKLTFSHHRELCPIDNPDIQDKFLDWCLSGNTRKTVRELREKVQAYLSVKDVAETEGTEQVEDNGYQEEEEGKAVETAPDGKVTAKHVEKVVEEIKPRPKPRDLAPNEAELISPMFKAGFRAMLDAIKNDKALNWTTTDKNVALRHILILEDVINS